MRTALVIGASIFLPGTAMRAQCTDYQLTIGGGTDDAGIVWDLFQVGGGIVASGWGPSSQVLCLPGGCYYMNMYDDVGDGWNGASYVFQEMPSMTVVAMGTLPNGFGDVSQVSLGSGCLPGCDLYMFSVTYGTQPTQISWSIVSNGVTFASGGAGDFEFLCLDTGCYVLNLFDSGGNGWQGATWTLMGGTGGLIDAGSLTTGSSGQRVFAIGVPTAQCAPLGPMSPSECGTAIEVCGNTSFAIAANGQGTTSEIPFIGSLGNPNYVMNDGLPSPWGTDNWGCLRINEHHSTWLIVHIAGSGSLEFSMGAGTQFTHYDWAMYPYDASTCAAIVANTIAPVRCNWNEVPWGGTGLAGTPPAGGDPNNYEPPLNVLAGQRYVICFSNYNGANTTVPLIFGGTAVVGCATGVLPLELLAFTGAMEGDAVRLRWTTATEQGTLRFDVEKSHGLSEWWKIGEVAAAGSSLQELHYGLLDPDPLTGMNYYRLRMIDGDGSYTLSDVVVIHMEDQAILLYPNPSDGAIWIESRGDVHVFDATGREAPFVRMPSSATLQHLIIRSPGVYLVRIDTGTRARYERIVIR